MLCLMKTRRVDDVGNWWCGRCKLFLDPELFGSQSWCRTCCAEYNRVRRAESTADADNQRKRRERKKNGTYVPKVASGNKTEWEVKPASEMPIKRNGGALRQCSKCRLTFPATEEFFYVVKGATDGFHSWCVGCFKSGVSDRNSRMSESERIARLDYLRTWHESNPKYQGERKVKLWPDVLVWAARKTSKAKGWGEPEITPDAILSLFQKQNGKCYWLGIKLVPTSEPRDPQRPSLDRLDNSRGYTLDNVVLSCAFANTGRCSATVERFNRFVSDLKRSIKTE